MTATETALDLGKLAILAEGFAVGDAPLAVEITGIAELPADPGTLSWSIDAGDTVVVVVALGDPSPTVEGIVGHFAAQLGAGAADPLDAGRPAPLGTSAVAVRAEDGTGVFAYLAETTTEPPAGDIDDVPDSGLISLGMLREVPLEVSAELGRTRLSVAEILQLNVGSIVELDRTAGAPVDVVVNGSLIARGEVVVIDDEYGVRITEIMGRVADSL